MTVEAFAMGTWMSSTPRNQPAFFDRYDSESSSAQGQQISTADGFSILELDRAGVSESRAHALGLPIDGTRHSALRHNVRHLRVFAR